jgi:hypothetical protein
MESNPSQSLSRATSRRSRVSNPYQGLHQGGQGYPEEIRPQPPWGPMMEEVEGTPLPYRTLITELSLHHLFNRCKRGGGVLSLPRTTSTHELMCVSVSCLKVACWVLNSSCLFLRLRISTCKASFRGWRDSRTVPSFSSFLKDQFSDSTSETLFERTSISCLTYSNNIAKLWIWAANKTGSAERITVLSKLTLSAEDCCSTVCPSNRFVVCRLSVFYCVSSAVMASTLGS